MTRKRRKTSGKKMTRGKTNGAAPYCGQPESSPTDLLARRRAEAFLLMQSGVFRHRPACKRPDFEPNDRHKRVDFLGHVRVFIGTADGISAAAPDDTLADHLYIAADPFSDLNPYFTDFATESMSVNESENEEDQDGEGVRIDDDQVIGNDEANPYANFHHDTDDHIPLPAHSGVIYCIEASRKRMQNRHRWKQHL